MTRNDLPALSWASDYKYDFGFWAMMGFDAFDTHRHPACELAYRAVIEWCEKVTAREMGAVVLWGNTGVGKSHLACAAWASFGYLAEPVHVKPMNMQDVFTAIRASYDDKRNGHLAGWVEDWDALILDDVGAEYSATPTWAWAQYQTILDHCYRGQVPVMVCTNLTPVTLRDCIGARSYSRLAEMAGQSGFVDMSKVDDYRIIMARGDKK